MSDIVPLITFRAGRCDGDTRSSSGPPKIKCLPTPGYLYIYMGMEDEMVHLCWRPRSQPASEPELDLIMIPGDGSFGPYTGKEASASSDNVTSPTNGRVFVLKFTSSSERHLFWLQSKSQHPDGKASWFSPRDLKLGQIIDMMLQGADVNVDDELMEINPANGDEDEDMGESDSRGPRLRANSTGGAGSGATGGDFREEGESNREGGADGGRATAGAAPGDVSAIMQNFLNSLKGSGSSGSTQRQEKLFCSLGDLLTPETCVPILEASPISFLDSLLSQLPPAIILLETRSDDLDGLDTTQAAAEEAIKSLSIETKRRILTRVIRSPQLRQSLGSLTVAIRDGGLPTVAEVLSIKVENGGYIRGGAIPLGGGDAVEAFVNGVEKTVKEEEAKGGHDDMDTS